MLFAACTKDEPRGEKIILSEMSQIESDIIDFLEKIDIEHEGSLPTADAVFFLEAGFNYRYAHIGNDQEFTITKIDTSFVNLAVFEGYSTYAEIKSAFDDIYEEMTVLFDAIEDDQKALSIIQVTHEDDNSLRVISVWKHSIMTFSGDWYWGFKQGMCDNSYSGRDAIDAILWRYHFNYGSPTNWGIWTNVQITFPLAHGFCQITELPTGQQNPFGYNHNYLFGWGGYGNPCLTSTQIDYYASRIDTILQIVTNHFNISRSNISKIILEPSVIPHTGKTYNSPHHAMRLITGDFEHGRYDTTIYDDFSN